MPQGEHTEMSTGRQLSAGFFRCPGYLDRLNMGNFSEVK